MPVSHICPSCLTELGRVPALPDPHYALPVVVCPECEYATVRVKHPDRVYWRQMRHLRLSLQRLWLTLLFTALSVGAVIGMVFWIQDELTSRSGRYTMPDLAYPGVAPKLLIAALIVLLCGCIARAIYAHRRFIEVLAIITVLTLFFITIDASTGWVMSTVRDIVGSDARVDLPSGRELSRRMLTLLPLVPIFITGMGLGVILNMMIVKSERKRISRIRRRLRRRQSRQD